MWELDCEESWAPKNWCFWTVVLERTLESPLDCKEIKPVHPKGDQSWVFIGRTDAKAETPILWPPHVKSWLTGKDWCWDGLGARGEGDDRGWDGWMASLTWWTWVWVNSGSWWWTGRPDVLQFMGLQRVGHDWATELNWTELNWTECCSHIWTSSSQGSHEFEQAPEDSEGQGSLACCDSWGCKESDTTEWLNWTELNWLVIFLLWIPTSLLSLESELACT